MRATDGSPEMAAIASKRLGRSRSKRCCSMNSTRSRPMTASGPALACCTCRAKNSPVFWQADPSRAEAVRRSSMRATRWAMATAATRSAATTIIRRREWLRATYADAGQWRRCQIRHQRNQEFRRRAGDDAACGGAQARGVKISHHLEDRQRQHGLREEADREGQRAEHRQAQRIDDQMCDARPEIDGAGLDRPLGGIVEVR